MAWPQPYRSGDGDWWTPSNYHRSNWASHAAGNHQHGGLNTYIGGGSARRGGSRGRRGSSRGREERNGSWQDRDSWNGRWQPEQRRDRGPRVAWASDQRDELGGQLAKARRLTAHRQQVHDNAAAKIVESEKSIAKAHEQHAKLVEALAGSRKNLDEAGATEQALLAQHQERGEAESDDDQDDTCMWTRPSEPAAPPLGRLCRAASQRSKDPEIQRLLRKAANALETKEEPEATQEAAAGLAASQTQPDRSQDVCDMAVTSETRQGLQMAYAAARLLPEPEQLAAIHAAMQQFIPQACPLDEPTSGKAAGKGKAAASTARAEPYLAAPS